MLDKLAALSQKISPGLRKLLGNTAWLLADQILRMGVGLIVGVWLARYLGPTQFGIYNYALVFAAGLFLPLASLGLNRIVVRDIVQNPSGKDKTLGTAFVLKLIGGIVAFLAAVGTIYLLYAADNPDDNLTRWVVGIVAAGMIFQAFETIEFWFESQVQSKYVVWAKTSTYLLINFLKIALLQMRAPLIAFAWVWLGEVALGALGLMLVYRLTGNYFTAWQASIQRAKTLLKESIPLIFSGFAVMIYLRIDAIMLQEMVGSQSVGIYAAATRISEIWYFIPSKIISSVSPSIMEAKTVSEELYYRRIQKLFNLMAGLSYAIAIPMTLLSKDLVVIMYGEDYGPAGSVLAIHIWASVFVFLGLSKGIWLITEGYARFALVCTVIGAVSNILLNLVLIPTYREAGSAIATVISYGCADYLVCLIYPPFRKIGLLMTNALTLNLLFTRIKRP